MNKYIDENGKRTDLAYDCIVLDKVKGLYYGTPFSGQVSQSTWIDSHKKWVHVELDMPIVHNGAMKVNLLMEYDARNPLDNHYINDLVKVSPRIQA